MRKPAFVLSTIFCFFGTFAVSFALAGDHGGGASHDGSSEHEHSDGAAVRVSDEQRRALDISVHEAGPGQIEDPVELLGEVEADGDRLAHISPRYAGIVREVRAKVGDTVRPGEVLAILESSESLARYELKTLIGGIVIGKHLSVGEAVTSERQAFVVADLDTVWIDLAIYQKNLAAVRVGEQVRVRAVQPGPEAVGSISYLTPVVDRSTRTATARILLPNPDRKWMPGMFVTAHILDDRAAAVSVPHQSIQRLHDDTVVFVMVDGGFEPRTVRIGRQGIALVEIVAGLSAGEKVASKNSFLLKAELSKSEAGHED